MVLLILKIAKPIDYDISEKELQSFIEKNLESIGDWGLQYIASYVPIGTGIIDILAIDDEDNPIIIECKKIGEKFDQDAVFQLMRYISWFIKDPNHIHILHRLINKKYPEKTDLGEMPLLVAIVGDVEEDVKNACWAIDSDVMLVMLNLVRDSDDDLLISPKIVLDTSVGGEKTIREPKTEKDHFTGRENMKSLYDELIKRLKNEVDKNSTSVLFCKLPLQVLFPQAEVVEALPRHIRIRSLVHEISERGKCLHRML